MPFYAVRKGETPGIYKTWPECQAQIKDVKGAQYKKFDTVEEAEKFIGFDLANKLKDEIAKLKKEAGEDTSSSGGGGAKRKSAEDSKKSSKKTKKSSDDDDDDDDDDASSDGEDGGGAGDADGSSSDISVPDTVLERARKTAKDDYPTNADGYVTCHTDGSCFMMGKKGQVSGVGVYFGPDHKMNLAEPIKDGKTPTNNRAKIIAVIYAVETLKASGVKKAQIYLDSEFTINCVDKWTPGWKKKGWKTAAGVDVKNKEELQALDKVSTIDIRYSRAADDREPSGYSEATRLAKEGAKKTFD